MNDFNKQLKANHKKYKNDKYTLQWYRTKFKVKKLLDIELSKYIIKRVYFDNDINKESWIEVIPTTGLFKKLRIKKYYTNVDEYHYWERIQENWLINNKYRLNNTDWFQLI